MGHHFLHNMTAIRNGLNSLTVDQDGVDGRHIYIYGEAWDFGEVALNQRGRNASQHNLGGSRMGAFNDRCADLLGVLLVCCMLPIMTWRCVHSSELEHGKE
jgi:pullulanase